MFEFNATFFIAMISFVVFIIIMNAIFYQPILSIIRKREDYINTNYEDTKTFQQQANEYNNSRKIKISEKQDESRTKIRSALDVAHQNSNKELEQAREKTKQDIEVQRQELQGRCKTVNEVIKNRVICDIASDIVSKIMGEESRVEDFDRDKIDKILG